MDPKPLAARKNLHVVLVEPEIPWNTGNVGRTCLAAGARLHLVRPLGFSLETRHLRRAGLDYWRHVEPRIWPGWSAFEEALPELGQPFFFSAEAEVDYWRPRYPEATVLIFGRESAGFSAETRRRYAENLVRVPMLVGPVRSLNLSTTSALAVYEVLRQWRGDGRATRAYSEG